MQCVMQFIFGLNAFIPAGDHLMNSITHSRIR